MSRLASLPLALALASALTGCSRAPYFTALTTPPPFTTASLCDQCDEDNTLSITLTQGVALAFECTDSETGAPCSRVSASLRDPTVASLFPGYLDALAPSTSNLDLTGLDGATAESVFVVVGMRVGDTTLSYASANGDAEIAVSVIAP